MLYWLLREIQHDFELEFIVTGAFAGFSNVALFHLNGIEVNVFDYVVKYDGFTEYKSILFERDIPIKNLVCNGVALSAAAAEKLKNHVS